MGSIFVNAAMGIAGLLGARSSRHHPDAMGSLHEHRHVDAPVTDLTTWLGGDPH